MGQTAFITEKAPVKFTLIVFCQDSSVRSAHVSGVSIPALFIFISNSTFPSPIILGVTVNDKAASLNSVVVVPSEVV